MTLSAPELLTVGCELEEFTSGVESLDAWLKRRAMKNQATGASRTFVACDGRRVAAYVSGPLKMYEKWPDKKSSGKECFDRQMMQLICR